MRARLIAASLLVPLVLVGCERNSPVGPDDDENPSGTANSAWSTPQHIPIDLPELPGAPAVAFAGERLLLAFHTQGSQAPTGIHLVERSGQGWSRPVGISRNPVPSGHPQIVAGPGGAAHLMWGERASNPTPRPGGLPTELWSSGSAGDAWSDPLRVHTGPNELEAPRRLVVDPAGRVLTAFSTQSGEGERPVFPSQGGEGEQPPRDTGPGRGPGGARAIHLAIATAAGWELSEVARGFYPYLHVGTDGRVSLVYVAVPQRPEGQTGPWTGTSDVFVRHSDDAGRSWTEPIAVHPADPMYMHHPVLVGGPGGRLHALWLKDLTGNVNPDAVYHSTSADGVTWSAPTEVAGPELHLIPGNLRAVVDGSGRLHVLFNAFDWGGPSRMYYAGWTEAGWSRPEHLFGANGVGHHSALALDAAGTLHLVLAGSDIGEKPGLYHSTRPTSR